MSVLGISECACEDFRGMPMPEDGPPPVWLTGGQRAIREAYATLDSYAPFGLDDRGNWRRIPVRLYNGGVHVDGVHVLVVRDDDGRLLFGSGGP